MIIRKREMLINESATGHFLAGEKREGQILCWPESLRIYPTARAALSAIRRRDKSASSKTGITQVSIIEWNTISDAGRDAVADLQS